MSRRFAGGFTLVELLLAVTLMSILLALAYGGLRAATRASERGQLLLEETSRIRSAHQFLRRQLNQMQPLPFAVDSDGDNTRIVFEGHSRQIQFVAPMPGYLGTGGPQVQLLQLVEGPEGGELWFSHAVLLEFEPGRLTERDPVVLLEGIETATFEFLGKNDAGQSTGWTDRWDYPDRLPAAVSLDVRLGGESRALWPLLSTGIKVDEIAVESSGAARAYSDAIRDMIDRQAREDGS